MLEDKVYKEQVTVDYADTVGLIPSVSLFNSAFIFFFFFNGSSCKHDPIG